MFLELNFLQWLVVLYVRIKTGSIILRERDFCIVVYKETETDNFKSVSNFATDTETFGRWSRSWRPALTHQHKIFNGIYTAKSI